ncbi:MAG: 60S ribosomal protein L31 [Candidatus Aenigmarchaeota archaeon]|nr:60S ribosomal protein L31 [Candidatus Aenigmarchaeota archaeon]
MADKKALVTEEKIYNIPLRKAFTPASRIEKTKKSVAAVRKYITKHTHASEVKISTNLNDMLWASGAKKPLKSITVKVNLVDGIANVRLPEEITLEEEKRKFKEDKDKKKEAEKTEEGKAEEDKKEEPKAEEKVKEQAKPEAKT